MLEDRVAQARVHIVWNVPQFGQHDVALLDLAASVICGGVSSRMYKRLVHEEKLASGVSAGVSAGTIAGQFSCNVSVRNGVSHDAVERALFEELRSFLVEGPTADELERVRTQALSGFIRSLDNTAGIAAMLAQNEVRLREPDAYRRGLGWIREATPAMVLQAARQWLSDGAYVLHVVPFPALRPVGNGVDRSKIPQIGASPRVSLPPLQWDVLSNGVRIVLAERHELPLVNLGLLFATGLADDPNDALGIMRLTARTMSCGAGSRNSYEFSEQRRRIGAQLAVNTNFEWSGIALSAMRAQLDASLELFFDQLLRPRLLEEDVSRERERMLELIAQESMAPGAAAGRVLPGLMFHRAHPYRRPFSGYGAVSQVSRLTREAVMQFHSHWMRPELATLIVVGDTTMAEIKARLAEGLEDWRPQVASWSRPAVPSMSAPNEARLYLIDKPGTPQAVVTAATVLPPVENRDALALKMLNAVLGGGFASRLNMNLREQKNWSYGVRANISGTIGPRLFNVGAPVQIDKAGASVQEIMYELRRIVSTNPVTHEELERIRRAELLRFGSGIASLGGLQSAMESLVQKNRTPDYWETYPDRLKALTLDDVNEIAVRLFDVQRMVWVIAGDLSKIEPQLTGLGLGETERISPDGEQLYA